MRQTNEGALAYEHSLDHALEFFSKAGSLFSKRGSFYGQEESAASLFQKTWIVDPVISFKLLLWLRDCRGGAGNRSGFRECLGWLAKYPLGQRFILDNLDWIPEVGRWDDLRSLFGTVIEGRAAALWAEQIQKHNVLAAKWADRKDSPVKHAVGFRKEGDFRKFLARMRKDHIVEHKMSTRRWQEIKYRQVPSVAMARYTNAFMRQDPERFQKFKERLQAGTDKVHTGALFPHDCVQTAHSGDAEMADHQFEALPDFMEDSGELPLVIADTSGSMKTQVSGSIRAVDISQGLALYCGAKIPADSPFHKKFLAFESEGKLKDWSGMKFSEAVNDHHGPALMFMPRRSSGFRWDFDREPLFDGAVGHTRIDKALNTLLNTARFFNVPESHMPTMLIIVSDMQFATGAMKTDMTEVELYMQEFEEAGYRRPKIVYWNTAGYAGQPATAMGDDLALVSGFSPSILKAVFDGEDLTPKGVMLKALEKYDIRVPEYSR